MGSDRNELVMQGSGVDGDEDGDGGGANCEHRHSILSLLAKEFAGVNFTECM